MQNAFFLLVAFLFVKPLAAQELTGKKDVSKWILFSGYSDKPQFKKIDNEKFFAYYRTSPDDAGIMVMDSKLNVLHDIQLKLTKDKRLFYNTKAFLDLLSYPDYYYRKHDNSVVLIGNIKTSDKGYAIVGLTYSLDSETLTRVDTLKHSQSDVFDVKLSKNEEHFVVWEAMKNEKSSKPNKKLSKFEFDVFGVDCKKKYTAILEQSKDVDVFISLLTNGELVGTSIKEEKKKNEYKYFKFDTSGKVAGSASWSTSKDDSNIYYFMTFIESPNQEVFVAYSKGGDQEGIAIVHVDFAKNSCKKLVDNVMDKNYLVKISSTMKLNHSLTKDKKIKPIEGLKNFRIDNAFSDKNGIYIIMRDIRKKVDRQSYTSATDGIRTKYSSDYIIALGFGLDGKEKWATPIKCDASYYEVINFAEKAIYNHNGTGIGINYFEDENNISMIVPCMDKIYATRINKANGDDRVPVLLNGDNDVYTNKNCLFWITPNQVVITTMKGIYFTLHKKVVNLHSMKINL